MYWKQQMLIALSLILDHVIKKNKNVVHLVTTKEKLLDGPVQRSLFSIYILISPTHFQLIQRLLTLKYIPLGETTFHIKVHSI